MIRTPLIFLFLLLSSPGWSQNGETIPQEFPNHTDDQNLRQGLWQEYRFMGYQFGEYRDGLKEGLWKYVHNGNSNFVVSHLIYSQDTLIEAFTYDDLRHKDAGFSHELTSKPGALRWHQKLSANRDTFTVRYLLDNGNVWFEGINYNLSGCRNLKKTVSYLWGPHTEWGVDLHSPDQPDIVSRWKKYRPETGELVTDILNRNYLFDKSFYPGTNQVSYVNDQGNSFYYDEQERIISADSSDFHFNYFYSGSYLREVHFIARCMGNDWIDGELWQDGSKSYDPEGRLIGANYFANEYRTKMVQYYLNGQIRQEEFRFHDSLSNRVLHQSWNYDSLGGLNRYDQHYTRYGSNEISDALSQEYRPDGSLLKQVNHHIEKGEVSTPQKITWFDPKGLKPKKIEHFNTKGELYKRILDRGLFGLKEESFEVEASKK